MVVRTQDWLWFAAVVDAKGVRQGGASGGWCKWDGRVGWMQMGWVQVRLVSVGWVQVGSVLYTSTALPSGPIFKNYRQSGTHSNIVVRRHDWSLYVNGADSCMYQFLSILTTSNTKHCLTILTTSRTGILLHLFKYQQNKNTAAPF